MPKIRLDLGRHFRSSKCTWRATVHFTAPARYPPYEHTNPHEKSWAPKFAAEKKARGELLDLDLCASGFELLLDIF